MGGYEDTGYLRKNIGIHVIFQEKVKRDTGYPDLHPPPLPHRPTPNGASFGRLEFCALDLYEKTRKDLGTIICLTVTNWSAVFSTNFQDGGFCRSQCSSSEKPT